MSNQTLSQALAELSVLSGPDAVADLLRREGIRGRRKEACDCPLARLLAARIGCRTVSVSYDFCWEQPGVFLGLGPSVGQFLARFDRGIYPDLEGN